MIVNIKFERGHTMLQNKCYTYFKIIGNFSPDTVSELLGVVPDKFWKIGDKRKNGTEYDFAGWIAGTCREYEIETDKQMMKTLAPLLSKIDILNKIRRQYDVDYVLEVVPSVCTEESTPCLSPSLEVMRFCCATETSIDIDLYVDDFKKENL